MSPAGAAGEADTMAPPPLPELAPEAARALAESRRALAAQDPRAALELCVAAVATDPCILCHPWGLVPHFEAEGRGSVRDRMRARLQDWYRPPRSPIHAGLAALSHKRRLRDWAETAGVRLPRLIAEADRLDGLDWGALGGRDIVIKPVNATNSQGVVLVREGVDHFARTPVGPDLGAHVRARWAAAGVSGSAVLVEEAVTDTGRSDDPALAIARDFKVFAVGGHAGFVRIHDRNAAGGKRALSTRDRLGRVLPQSQKRWPEAPRVPVPDGWGELIAEAERLSRIFSWLLRFDFYLSPEGPLLGEITTYPNAGLGFSHFGRRTMLQMWEVWPDDRPA